MELLNSLAAGLQALTGIDVPTAIVLGAAAFTLVAVYALVSMDYRR